MAIENNPRLIALCASLVLSACTWVSLSEQGRGVRIVKASEVTSCRKVGNVTAQTSDRAAIFARTDRKVEEEIAFLARNEAAKLGGNAVVPAGPRAGGSQSFAAYRCP